MVRMIADWSHPGCWKATPVWYKAFGGRNSAYLGALELLGHRVWLRLCQIRSSRPPLHNALLDASQETQDYMTVATP